MGIYLSDEFIAQMPELRRIWLLNYYSECLKTESSLLEEVRVCQQPSESKTLPMQLVLNLESQTKQEKANHSHITFDDLCDAGITKPGMSLRVRLTRDMAKKLDRKYINGLEISQKGTVFYDGQEFHKPSPLAKKVNGSPCNGWEYIEIKKDGQWTWLDKLRELWRKTND